jgi:hypothetical protein
MIDSRSRILGIFVLFALGFVTVDGHADDYYCSTPYRRAMRCQYGSCKQTVYIVDCSILLNQTLTCANFGQTVNCCGGELPTYAFYPCGIVPLHPATSEILAQRFGSSRIFVPTCSRGYHRLSTSLAR